MQVASALPDARPLLPRLAEACREGRLALFLDFDGTLAPIVPHPDQARLPDRVRAALERLAGRAFVAVVSGRELADIRPRIGLPGIWYAGSHGLEIQGPDGRRHVVGEACITDLDALEREVEPLVRAVPGAWIERKRLSIAVHVRAADEAAGEELGRKIADLTARHGGLRLVPGKKVFEVKPDVGWNKGRAVRWMLEHAAPPGALPVFLGDDVTDEDAFAELGETGIGILVGDGRPDTHARFRLRDPEAVGDFLDELARACAGG